MTTKISGTSGIETANVSFPDGDNANAVVGTVSQAAGVPTGAIIERGSNVNGEYVKYADGTLIQWGVSPTVTSSSNFGTGWFFGSATITFPISFVNTNYVISGGTFNHTNWTGWANFVKNSVSVASVYYMSGASNSTCTCPWMAIGRWF